jgi:hypothetical protein
MAKKFLTGIQAISATFTGNVSVANPTLPEHAATKSYVDSVAPTEIDGGAPDTVGDTVIDGGTF